MPAPLADLAFIAAYLLDFLLLLLPGLAVAMTVAKRRELPAIQALILVITSSAALGYVAFWIYFANRNIGKTFSYACFAVSIIAVPILFTRYAGCRVLTRAIAVPLGYAAAIGVTYLCWFSLFHNPLHAGPDLANSALFTQVRPGDNLIPYIFAQKIYSHEPLRPFCCGDWLSSDRPPLQAGIYLLLRPLRLIGSGVNDQLVGTVLQSLWISGCWLLLTALGATTRQIRQILGLLAFSGFLFFNTIYVWPKLVAANFILFIAAMLIAARAEKRRFTTMETSMAAASFALAILAHPGCVFSAPALILLWLPVRKLITVRQYVYAAVLIVSFQLSWAAYQHIYDPPGNRLLKMHLGGVMEPDNRSTWQAIKSGYTQPAAGTLVHNKLLNFENILGPNLLHKGIGWESLRIAERDSISYAIGVLNLGWVAAIIYFMKGKRRERLGWGMLILLSLVDMAIWATVIYGPGYTDTTESSYFDLLLLSIGLCGFLISVRRLAMLAFVLQVVNVLAVWVWFVPSETAAGGAMLQWPFLLIGICCTSALVWHFGHVYKAEPSEIVGKG